MSFFLCKNPMQWLVMSCTWKNLFVDKNIPLREVGNRISKISTFFRSFFNTNFKVLNFEHFVLFQSTYIYYKVQISNNKNTVKLWKTKSCSMCNSLSSTCSQSFVKNKKLFSYFRGCYIMTANNINNTRIIFEKKTFNCTWKYERSSKFIYKY